MPRERRLNLPLQPVPATEVAAVVDEVASRLDELEDKLTAVLTRILERAGRTATASFRRHVTDHLTAAALREADRAALQRIRMGDLGNGLFGYRLRPEVLTAAAPSQTSAMICVKPRPVEAEAIADPDGEPPDDLHVTLVYLGDVEDSDLQALVDAVRPVAASHAPLTGTVGGYGRFEPAGVGILLPDVPGLVELRVAVTEALVDADLDYARNHGFEAHITIDADPEADEADLMLTRSGQPLHFDALLLVRGDAIVAELPLVGRPPLTAAGPPDTTPFEKRVDRAQQALRDALGTGNENAIREAKDEVRSAQDALYKAVATPQWTAPGADELLNVDALMKALRTKTNPVRQALIENILGTTRKLVDPIETNYRWELIPSDEVSSDSLLEDVLGWPGDAEDVAGAAITEAESGTGNLYVLRDRSTSRIVAVANVEEGRDALIVHNVASLGGGTGTTLLQTIARNAGIDNLGVRLRATPAAANYYRGLPGFEEGQNLDFHLPADKAPGFAAGTVGGGTSRAAQMFDVTNPLVAKALATTGEHITSIGDTTRANVMKVIDASWQQGLSIPNTAKAIQAAMADAAPIRARMIARTELVGAINGGSLAATQLVAASTGSAYMKQWRTAPGAPNPRHELYDGLNGQTVGMDEAFDVGGDALQYPGDPNGQPEEVINCRCTMTYVEGGADVGEEVSADDAGDTPPPPPTAKAVRDSIDAPTMWGEPDELTAAQMQAKVDGALARQGVEPGDAGIEGYVTPISHPDAEMLGGAATAGPDGTLESVHVTSDPQPVLDRLKSGAPLVEGRGTGLIGDLGSSGLYVSARPDIWEQRSLTKYITLSDADKKAFADDVVQAAEEKGLAATDLANVRRLAAEMPGIAGPNTAYGILAGLAQQYDLPMIDIASRYGIGSQQVPVVLRGNFARFHADATFTYPDERVVSALKESGVDGAYFAGSDERFPQLVVWNDKAVLQFGDWKRPPVPPRP